MTQPTIPPMTTVNRPGVNLAPVGWSLLASVLLNLFLVGVVVGVGHHRHHHTAFAPLALEAPHSDYLVGWMTGHLDQQDAQIFQDAYISEADNLNKAHEHMHQATAELAKAFGQTQPDPTALTTAENHLMAARKETGDAVNRVIGVAYTKLSPEGRQRIADLTKAPM